MDFGRVTERDGGGARDSVSCGHLPLLAGIAIGGVVQDGDRKSLGVPWMWCLCRTTLHDRVYSGVCIPLALISLLTVLCFRIYSILRAFTFLVSLISIGYRLQVFWGK